MLDKISRLEQLSDGSVTIRTNMHKDAKVGVLRYLKDNKVQLLDAPPITRGLVRMILEHDSIAECKVTYRNALVFAALGYNAENAVDRLLELIEKLVGESPREETPV